MKPEALGAEPHKLLQRLRALGLCEEPEPHVHASWVAQISTRAVACWACNVVVAASKPVVLGLE